jgi:polyhydroxybutyrate depolymerase
MGTVEDMPMRVVVLMFVFAQVALTQPPPKAPATLPSAPPPAMTQPGQTRRDLHLERKTWMVENHERTALLHVPPAAKNLETPVVFAFHGHGGSAPQASRSFRMHTLWPEAIVVYMQGLPTPGALTDPEGKKNGWQNREGLQDDRDLKFFDAVLATLKTDYKMDERRVFAMGHSNGGGFTYLLWQTRPDVFTAFAPSGAFSIQARNLKPRPAMHIAGKSDELVKFEHQQRTIEVIRKINGCAEKGEEWAKDCTVYPSKTGTPLVTFVYDGTHKYPVEAPALIVKFFKEQTKPAPKEAVTRLSR